MARARELVEEIDECRVNNDTARAEILQAQLDALVDEAETAAGLANRSRVPAGNPERARTAVRAAIKRAIVTIEREHPRLTQHLRDAITTGKACSYMPSTGDTIEWSVHR